MKHLIAASAIFSFTFLLINISTAQERGMASVFPDQFDGRKTASGIIFSKDHYHAAHPKLAFGETVTVVNPARDLSVKVKIVDRGPFLDNRIIELSSRAAKDLGIPNGGEVVIYPGDKPTKELFTPKGSKADLTSNPKSNEASGQTILKKASDHYEKGGIYQVNLQDVDSGQYFIQVAALSKFESVLQLTAKLQALGFTNIVFQADNRFIKVAIGPYRSATAAGPDKNVLVAKDFKPIVIPW